MTRNISFDNKNISYTLRKSKRVRRMRLAVFVDGSVVVTTPYNLRENIAEKFIREKSRWLFTKLDYFRQFKLKPVARHSQGSYLKSRDDSYRFVIERVQHFNNEYTYPFKRVSIRNQKTRWGSCSKKGNLSFNYKITSLPPRLADYIIVHELCHLKEFNHSKKFWSLVGQTFPDYKEIKKTLKQYSLSLG
ncbi:M48 family metallopeptidase [Patescibacteria group bacterium]